MSKIPTAQQVHDALADETLLPAHRLVLEHHTGDLHTTATDLGLRMSEVVHIRRLLLRRACEKLNIDLDRAVEEDEIAKGTRFVLLADKAPFTVQDRHPTEQPEWGNRYANLNPTQAKMYFEGINIGLGWQKRLLDKDGAVVCEAVP